MIHELGHAFQMRHTNNETDMMAPGHIKTDKFQRTLSSNDIAGANHLRLLAMEGEPCGFLAMSPYVCTTSTKNEEANLKYPLLIIPNPNNGVFSLESDILKNECKIEIYNLQGNVIYSKLLFNYIEHVNIDLPILEPSIYFIKLENVKSGEKVYDKISIF